MNEETWQHGYAEHEGRAFGTGALRDPNPFIDSYYNPVRTESKSETQKGSRSIAASRGAPRAPAFGQGALRSYH